MRSPLSTNFPNESTADLKSVGRVLRQLSNMDPDGQEFRYASRQGGSDTLPHADRMNLLAFQKAMLGVANYLDAVDRSVGERLSTKHEMDACYAAEFSRD
jgi:hypothetical protein